MNRICKWPRQLWLQWSHSLLNLVMSLRVGGWGWGGGGLIPQDGEMDWLPVAGWPEVLLVLRRVKINTITEQLLRLCTTQAYTPANIKSKPAYFAASTFKERRIYDQMKNCQLLKEGGGDIILTGYLRSVLNYWAPRPFNIQGVTGGTDQTSGESSLGHTIPI